VYCAVPSDGRRYWNRLVFSLNTMSCDSGWYINVIRDAGGTHLLREIGLMRAVFVPASRSRRSSTCFDVNTGRLPIPCIWGRVASMQPSDGYRRGYRHNRNGRHLRGPSEPPPPGNEIFTSTGRRVLSGTVAARNPFPGTRNRAVMKKPLAPRIAYTRQPAIQPMSTAPTAPTLVSVPSQPRRIVRTHPVPPVPMSAAADSLRRRAITGTATTRPQTSFQHPVTPQAAHPIGPGVPGAPRLHPPQSVTPSTALPVVVVHAVATFTLCLIVTGATGLASNAQTSFVIQALAAGTLILLVIWVWATAPPSQVTFPWRQKRGRGPRQNKNPWRRVWDGAGVAILLFAVWLVWGLLAAQIFSPRHTPTVVAAATAKVITEFNITPTGSDVNGPADMRATSFPWFTGLMAETIAASVAVLSHLPGVIRRWPDACRHALGPFLVILMLLPNRDLLLDPRLWPLISGVAHSVSTWQRILVAVMRSAFVYILCVLAWHTAFRSDINGLANNYLGGGSGNTVDGGGDDSTDYDPQDKTRPAINWLRRTALCVCRVTWITQTGSPLLLLLGTIASLGVAIADIATNGGDGFPNVAPIKSLHFSDPELGNPDNHQYYGPHTQRRQSPTTMQALPKSILRTSGKKSAAGRNIRFALENNNT